MVKWETNAVGLRTSAKRTVRSSERISSRLIKKQESMVKPIFSSHKNMLSAMGAVKAKLALTVR